LADGRSAQGSGFLLFDCLVATNQRWLVEVVGDQRTPIAAERIEILLDNQPRRVERVFLSRASAGDIALLRLAESVETRPFRLGHANLVHVGDPVWTIIPGANLSEALVCGRVNKFEAFPEWNIRLLKVSLRVPALTSGAPLLNDLGEVVGILIIKDKPGELSLAEICFAQTADSFEPLLAAAGFSSRPA
jgi:molecular chaperone DnaK